MADDDLAQRNAEHEPTYTMVLTLRDVEDLAAGCASKSVVAMARMLLDDYDYLARNARRPLERERRKEG